MIDQGRKRAEDWWKESLSRKEKNFGGDLSLRGDGKVLGTF